MTGDPIVVAAKFLRTQLPWLRHATDEQGVPRCIEAFAEIRQVAGRMRSLIDGARERRYLGPCGAQIEDDTYAQSTDCDGDVYAPIGAATGTCRTCKAKHDVDTRRDWLDETVRGWAFSAEWISEALGIPVKTIESWAAERPESRDHNGKLKRSATPAKLATYWRTSAGLVAPWTPTADRTESKMRGPRLHYVGDVRDVARTEALRRHERDQKRSAREAR